MYFIALYSNICVLLADERCPSKERIDFLRSELQKIDGVDPAHCVAGTSLVSARHYTEIFICMYNLICKTMKIM